MPFKKPIEERIENAQPFEVDLSRGLTSEQVAIRKKEGLTNKVQKHVTKTYPQILFDNLFNSLNIVLALTMVFMLASGISRISSYFFAIILASNSIIGLYQDIHARILVDRLRVVTDPKALVLRDGKEKEIGVKELVLSDVVLYRNGDQILADGIVLEGEISVDESLLTGESRPIHKKPGDALYSGSFLVKGFCKAKVKKVGRANYAETLQKEASNFARPHSEIQSSISRIMRMCVCFAVGLFLMMYVQNGIETGVWLKVWEGESGFNFVSRASAAVVGSLPSGMFLLTSLTLAVGVVQLARRKMLVQELYCIEMLARVDMLCLDKTGTLTDGSMAVSEIVSAFGHSKVEVETAISAILHYTQDQNATAIALRKKCGDACTYVSCGSLPFDSATKYSAVSLVDVGTYFMGAPGFVPAKEDSRLMELAKSFMEKGYRVLLIAHSSKMIVDGIAPKKAEPFGIVVLSDHIKEDAKDNIAWFQGNNVAIRIISGDDPITVSEIASQCGVLDADKFVSLEGKSLEEVAALAKEYRVFGRVSPEQKAELIKTYKAEGHKVAMTGDGVNDILALKVADCSIAMSSGSSAARNVAHLVSLDNGFSHLPDVVAQGRRVINNLQRTSSLFLCKTIFVVAMSLIFLISSFAGGASYPYETSHMLVWEVATIGLSSYFLALQPSRERLTGPFLRNILMKAIPGGFAAIFAGITPFIFAAFLPNWVASDPTCVEELTTTMSVMLFSGVSSAILLRVCWPLDRFRFFVFLGALIGGIGAFVIDAYVPGKVLLGLHWSEMGPGFYPLLIGIFVAGAGVYYLLDYLARNKPWRKTK